MALSSMTGFARGHGVAGAYAWSWEIKSVNAKGLDLRLRLPPGWDAVEVPARKRAADELSRGSVFANLRSSAKAWRRPSGQRAGAERGAGDDEKPERQSRGAPARLDGILALKGVMEIADEDEREDDRRAAETAIAKGFDKALADLSAMRREEGATLGELSARLCEIAALIHLRHRFRCDDGCADAHGHPRTRRHVPARVPGRARARCSLLRAGGRRVAQPVHRSGPREPLGSNEFRCCPRTTHQLDRRLHRVSAYQRLPNHRCAAPTPSASGSSARPPFVAPTVLVHPPCNSWYNGGNVPGKTMGMGYTAGIPEYRRRCDQIAAAGYTGFKLASSMKTWDRVWRIGRDVAGVLPRAHAALRREGRNPLSPGGLGSLVRW